MHILFDDGTDIPITIYPSDLSPVILKIFKHLQHVTLPFRPWDSYLYVDEHDRSFMIDRLCYYGSLLGINVDKEKCSRIDQNYFNQLHMLYESHYDGSPSWLDFHEHIHLSERKTCRHEKTISLDYREKSGLLEIPYNHDWVRHSTSDIATGDVYVSWAELGKTPFYYWANQEPDDLDRICKLAKPWLKFRPKLKVALEPINRMQEIRNKSLDEQFDRWWKQYHDDWCRHWGIDSWTIDDMFACNVIGHIDSISLVDDLLQARVYPVKVTL